MTNVEREDYVWLTGDEAGRWLARVADDAAPVERLAARLRRELSVTRTHLILEQRELRHRARSKFAQADRLFFTRQTLEQATDQRLAEWKAARFPPGTWVVDLCSGIGGDALALAGRGPVLAVERDPCVAWLLESNGRALGATHLRVLTADAARVLDELPQEFSRETGCGWHLDPDRRASGSRTSTLDYCEPGPAAIARWRTWSAVGAVKLAPATQIPRELASQTQREWLETRGECRQQLLWFGELAAHHGRRVATIVDSVPGPRTVVEASDPVAPRIVEQPLRYVAEARPAIYAAGLATSLAQEFRAEMLGVEHGYLTSDEKADDAAWRQFEVLEVLPFDRRRLKAAIRERGWRRVTWKSRGVNVDLNRLSRELACEGDETGVVLLAEVAGRSWAMLARPAALETDQS